MEYGIISSGVLRTHSDEKEEEEEEEEEKPRAQQQVKVLKFRTFGDDHDDEINTVRERDSESEEQGVNYVLRENPKKSKRFVVMGSSDHYKELNDNYNNSNVCKECGKGFQSLKALCGHMASHSEKDRLRVRSKEEKASAAAHSDTESSGPKKKKRRRRRGSERKVGIVGSFFGAEREQQEVAISLMLLSRDSGGGFQKRAPSDDSVVESSSNNVSVILEAKSDPKIIIRDEDGSENSDSGYFRNGPKKGESSDALMEVECRSKLLGKSFISDAKYELRKRSRKKPGSRSDEPEAQKRTKYECSTCRKTFSSHTALGGHRASHAKTNAAALAANNYCGSVCSLGENSIETDEPSAGPTRDLGPSPIKKGHECPICFRMFKSGQALGGHKRSHFVGGREASSAAMIRRELTHNIEPEPEQPEIAVLFDLNLPAPAEDEDGEDGNVGIMEW